MFFAISLNFSGGWVSLLVVLVGPGVARIQDHLWSTGEQSCDSWMRYYSDSPAVAKSIEYSSGLEGLKSLSLRPSGSM
jgi:hypothetical protein